MSGIRSTSGVPPTLAGSSQSPSSGSEQVAAVNPAPPAGQQSGLPVATPAANPGETPEPVLLNAVVTARTASDNVILHTEVGNFRVTSESPLLVGSQVSFELNKTEDVFLARLISIDGKVYSPPLALKLLQIIDKPTSSADGYVRAGKLHPLELSTGLQNLTATLGKAGGPFENFSQPILPGPNTADTRLPDPKTLPVQKSLSVYTRAGIQNAEIPLRSPAAIATETATYGALPQKPEAAFQKWFHIVEAEFLEPEVRPVSNQRLPHLPVTEEGKQKIILQEAPAASLAPGKHAPYTGTVIAVSDKIGESGVQRVQVNSPAGSFSYQTTNPPPAGTTVQFVPADDIAAFPLPYTDIQQPGPRPPLVSLMGDWQNLRLALNVVAHQDPIAAQSVISNVIPQANAQLSGNLLFFLTALQFGSIGKWLGQDFQNALKDAGRTNLLQSLDDDFASLRRIQSDPGGQDWKSLNFPFFDGTNIRQVRLFHRQNGGDEENEEQKEGDRFIIELNLSKVGPLQLDGLFRRKKFDLVLRSETEIPVKMKSDIIALFSENMEIAGLNGQVVFNTVRPFPVDPLAEWESANSPATSTPS